MGDGGCGSFAFLESKSVSLDIFGIFIFFMLLHHDDTHFKGGHHPVGDVRPCRDLLQNLLLGWCHCLIDAYHDHDAGDSDGDDEDELSYDDHIFNTSCHFTSLKSGYRQIIV